MPRHTVSRIHAIKSICALVVGFGVLGLDQTLLFGEDPLGGYWLLVLGSQRTRDMHFSTPPLFYKPVTV